MTLRGCEIEYHADGTRYRLLVVADPSGGLIVTWPEGRWSAWASEHAGGEVDLRHLGTAIGHARDLLAAMPEARLIEERVVLNRRAT
jgi:hypothetical protein